MDIETRRRERVVCIGYRLACRLLSEFSCTWTGEFPADAPPSTHFQRGMAAVDIFFWLRS